MFITNSHASFHLLWEENLVKYKKSHNIMSTVVVILIFWTRFAQKRLLRSKTEKVIELIKVLNFSLNLQFQIFGPIHLPNKYALYIFVIHQTICCISFTNRTNIATENPKTSKILPFHRLCTKTWRKIQEIGNSNTFYWTWKK